MNKATPSIGGSRVEVGTYHDDFVTHLQQTSRKHNAVWVIVDLLNK